MHFSLIEQRPTKDSQGSRKLFYGSHFSVNQLHNSRSSAYLRRLILFILELIYFHICAAYFIEAVLWVLGAHRPIQQNAYCPKFCNRIGVNPFDSVKLKGARDVA